MPVFNNILAGAAGSAGGAAGYEIERSLRFNDDDSAYLNRMPSSAGNRKTWTWSGWVKRSTLTGAQCLFMCEISFSEFASLIFNASDQLQSYLDDDGSGGQVTNATNAVFRDVSAWYHVVWAVDSTNATASDRVKLYVNGVDQSYTGGNIPPNGSYPINSTTAHSTGIRLYNNADKLDAYLADIHFIDGQALAATDFGKYDDDNNWNPKAFSGTYGTNGFHLDFSDNSSNAALGTDSSGNSNDWTVNNLTTAVDYGFTSAAAITSSQTFSFPITYAATVTYECFVRVLTPTTYTYLAGASASDWNIGINATDALFWGDFTDGYAYQSFLNTGLTDGLWHFFRLTTDGTNTSLYIDGVLKETKNASGFGSGNNGAGTYTNTINNGNFQIAHLRITNGGTPPTTGIPTISSMNQAAGTGGTLAFYDALDDIASSGTKTSDGGNVTITMAAATTTNVTAASPDIDSLIDTPTNYEASSGNNGGNYATLNPLDKSSSLTLSNGNLDFSAGATANVGCRSTFFITSGKYYWEITNTSGGGNYTVGIANSSWPLSYVGVSSSFGYGSQGAFYPSSSGATGTAANTAGDVVGVAFDADNGTLDIYVNGTSLNTASGWGTIPSDSWSPAFGSGINVDNSVNFGQRPFAYTPPTGYKSLCTQNLDPPTIDDGSTAFDTVLYSGNSSTQDVSGLSFNPDLLWIKSRTNPASGNYHHLHDSVRGLSSGFYKNLYSNTNEAEDTYAGSSSGGVTSFNDDGFSLANSGTSYHLNESTYSYVAWAWDAGTGSPVSNSDGDITTSVMVNQAAGFSIATYSYDNSLGSQTLGHGLGVIPDLVIRKDRNLGEDWSVYSKAIGFTQRGHLNLPSAWSNTNTFGSASATSTLNRANNMNTGNYVDYSFAAVEGYSAFGSYTGNGSTTGDGPFVYTGFRPALVMVKTVTTGESGWFWVQDTARDPYNVSDSRMFWGDATGEVTATGLGGTASYEMDILSNGFKIRNSHNETNVSDKKYIYAAWAEHPFKTARAR